MAEGGRRRGGLCFFLFEPVKASRQRGASSPVQKGDGVERGAPPCHLGHSNYPLKIPPPHTPRPSAVRSDGRRSLALPVRASDNNGPLRFPSLSAVDRQ